MYNKSLFIIIFIIVGIVFVSCRKDNSPAKTDSNPFANISTGIYAVGQTDSKAVLWYNGNQIFTVSNAQFNALYVSDSFVWIVGFENVNGKMRETLWKNDNKQYFSTSNKGYLSGVIVTNNIYLIGQTYSNSSNAVSHAHILINGIQNALSIKESKAESIFISGNDVYVGGSEYNFIGGYPRAVIWKNGSPLYLSDSISRLLSVFVLDNDVYAAGINTYNKVSQATIWKNGIPTLLSNQPSFVKSIFIDNNKIFAIGAESQNSPSKPMFWINGNATNLSDEGGFSSVFIKNSNIYVGGAIIKDGYTQPVVWINGKAEVLSHTGTSGVSSIFVK